MEENTQKSEGISKTLLTVNGILFISIIFMVFVIYGVIQEKHKKSIVVQAKVLSSKVFDNLTLSAKAVYVFDISKNEVIYKKNEFTQLPLASITKLMMALTAIELVPKDSGITIRKEFLGAEGDTGLLVNESWKLKDLLDFSLLVSSNDGARSVASVVGALDLKSNDYNLGRKDFIKKMNTRAVELGLKQTYFINESGLDEGGLSGGYGSAIDVAKLMEYILVNKPEILEATKYSDMNIHSFNAVHSAKNTNTDIGDIPGLLASKTGFTDRAGGNLAIAFDSSIGRPIIVVVLGSTPDGRFLDVSALVKASLEYTRE